MDNKIAYKNQSKSLSDVQIRGSNLEKYIRDVTNGVNGRVIYDGENVKADMQMDSIYPSIEHPEVIFSVTHTKPNTKGHSNENKFQLKLGELYLLKTFYPGLKVVIVVGGRQEEWLNYVLDAFKVFFDDTVYIWNIDDFKKLQNKGIIKAKHTIFWDKETIIRTSQNYSSIAPPDSYLRENFYNKIVKINMGVDSPSQIKNEIFRRCMEMAYIRYIESDGKSGSEWATLHVNTPENYSRFWEMRSFFNPSEASVMITLERMGLAFYGGIAEDVTVPSMLHDLGMKMERTKLSEDFVVWSLKYNCPVLIQCKSSGGGKERHGKNIQNRAKEQIGRGLLYRCSILPKADGEYELISKGKWFKWVSILDNDWGVTKSYPNKYVRMLQIAGYDKLFAADSLVDETCDLKYPNPLSEYLTSLDCTTDVKLFKEKMIEANIGTDKAYVFQKKLVD